MRTRLKSAKVCGTEGNRLNFTQLPRPKVAQKKQPFLKVFDTWMPITVAEARELIATSTIELR